MIGLDTNVLIRYLTRFSHLLFAQPLRLLR
jgi:hypothetical protein